MEKTSDLCSVCRSNNLPLDNFFQNSKNHSDLLEDEFELGTLDEISQRASCPLCRLVSQAVIHAFPELELGELCECTLMWEKRMLSSSSTKERTVHAGINAYTQTDQRYSRIVPLSDEKDGPLHYGRRVNPLQVDFELIRGWLESCQSWHGSACLVDGPTSGLQLRFVDVVNNCITETFSECRYIALSYVWGAAKTLQARKDNIKTLETPGALSRLKQQLPLTIQDSMSVVRKLGERYLWVDSLCIIQDDEDNKGVVIANMDIVYSQAFFTIVAASGSCANAGLPGVRPHTRQWTQAVEEVQPGLRLTVTRNWNWGWERNVYATRGWT